MDTQKPIMKHYSQNLRTDKTKISLIYCVHAPIVETNDYKGICGHPPTLWRSIYCSPQTDRDLARFAGTGHGGTRWMDHTTFPEFCNFQLSIFRSTSRK